MIAKKKQILTATLVIALICAVGVNWYYSKPYNNPVSQTATQAEEKNLGDSLLVAPIFNEESLADYYLPAGRWTDFFTGEGADRMAIFKGAGAF